MDGEIPEHYFTLDGRLASFNEAQPVRRRSNVKGKTPKAVAWPHESIDPDSLARAGFYFDPTPEYPDNAVCFLCRSRVGGWEDDDSPLEEHLRLSPRCGWALVAAIEAGLGDYGLDDPTDPQLLEARKATFAGRWPHEGKRGWKCKTKQMVDAGWKYTPTLESDDMATCTYCQLALDGWEPADKPMNEHYKRSPDCAFFRLIEQYQQGPPKKAARGKAARSSKASRLSSQSVATLASIDTTSLTEQSIDQDDTVLTTTSTMTSGGTKKGRAKKGTAKGKKARAKKDEPVEVHEDEPEEVLRAPPPPPPKPARGRKRASNAVEDSVLTNAEAPAPKKRATRGHRSNAVESSVIEPTPTPEYGMGAAASEPAPEPEAELLPVPAPKAARKKGRASKAKSTSRASAVSTTSTASGASAQEVDSHVMDDEEIDRQLMADLDRPLSDDEMIAADSDSERKKATKKKTKTKRSAAEKSFPSNTEDATDDHAMFDPSPVEMDEAEISAELQALQEQVKAGEAEAVQVPKKGRKGVVRKASKQTKASKKQEPAMEALAEPEPQAMVETEPIVVDEEPEVKTAEIVADAEETSAMSNTTVLKASVSTVPAPKKRGRPKKASTQSQTSEPSKMRGSTENTRAAAPSQPKKKTLPPPVPIDDEEDELNAPATPRHVPSPAPAAKQPVISPSQSPQSSDAENQPPSSKPSNTAESIRTALAPVAATPQRASPSKRSKNVLGGLESNRPWTAMDLDVIFDELNKENASVLSRPLLSKTIQLTSPEKKMTVEEWIYHNAGLAETKLQTECEATVSKFESEGGRAMRVLEELVVE